MSKKIVLAADGATASVGDADIADIFTTVFSSDSAVTGTYGLVQRGLLVLTGMSIQSKRKLGTFNPL